MTYQFLTQYQQAQFNREKQVKLYLKRTFQLTLMFALIVGTMYVAIGGQF